MSMRLMVAIAGVAAAAAMAAKEWDWEGAVFIAGLGALTIAHGGMV